MSDRLLRVIYRTSTAVIVANGGFCLVALVRGWACRPPWWASVLLLAACAATITIAVRPGLWERARGRRKAAAPEVEQ
ncbi:MAG: hypothetical protein JWO31_1978 [Phycisphaerales bacterium]|nr:hypothetical protein [Phycisphaerales bacterium]